MQTSNDSRFGMIVANYKLLSVLGAGSMSVVYLAQRLDDQRALVAVKLLQYQGLISPDDQAAFRMRFQREARAASQLRNEYILPVLSSGDEGDLPYMVMPVIVGGTLVTRLANQPQPMPFGEIARYLTQLANAVDYAHAQGVIHRDIKPSNILLDEHGHVYLTDFGIARLYDSGDNALTRENSPTLTRTGQVLGTPYYMAPEQIQAIPTGPQADIYALGVVLYQMVTGQVPFHGDTPLAVAVQHLQEAPPAPGLLRQELPPPLEVVILRALAKDPAQRYPSATEFADAFQAGLAEIDDPMATRAPVETWPFSLSYASSASTVQATPSETLVPQAQATPDKLVGLTVDGYHIGAVIDSDDLGTVFTATRDGAAEPVRMRFLTMPDATPKQVSGYLLQFEQRAHTLAALRHPNLAPVIGYGAFEGQPFLVTADNPGTAMSDVLAQHGAEEPATVADVLDQVVSGLEAAHRRGFLHLSLTAGKIIRQDDGRIVVADVGVRGLLDAEGDGRAPSRATSDANTPEQITGNPVDSRTDVYALGVVLYHMLTGRQVFTGATRDDVVQQHLHSTIPPLRRWRPSLPTALESTMSQAMAKEPKRRFQTPRELAAAYHAAITHTQQDASLATPIYSALRNSADDAALGVMVAAPPRPAQGMAATPPVRPEHPVLTPLTSAWHSATHSAADSMSRLSRVAPAKPPWLTSRLVRGVIALVLIVGAIAGLFAWTSALANNRTNPRPVVVAPNAAASVMFFDNTANGPGFYSSDALKLAVTSLPAPKAGHWYAAWLINDKTEKVQALGKLVLQSGPDKVYALQYNGSGSRGQPGVNLLGFGNRIKITDETRDGQLPAGPSVMEGAFPPHAFVHIQHLLVAFPTTPRGQGLLVGMMQQMNLLFQQANVLQQWISLHYPRSTNCAAQSVIDIIEGQSGANYKPMGTVCNVAQPWPAGDGFGLLGSDGYLAGVADHAGLASSSDDATPHIRLHSTHVQIAVQNITKWLQTVDQEAQQVLAGTADTTTSSDIVRLSGIALNGQDVDGDETIDPVANEAGSVLAYTHGQLLAMLTFGPKG